MKTLEVMSTFLRGSDINLIFIDGPYIHPEKEKFIDRATRLGYTSIEFFSHRDTILDCIVDKTVCPMKGSITVAANGSLWPCPFNRYSDVKFKAVATDDITLCYTYESDLKLREQLNKGRPCQSCFKFCHISGMIHLTEEDMAEMDSPYPPEMKEDIGGTHSRGITRS
jgi:hypothetical protein